MGAIFEVEHTATERRVALKLLFPHIMSVASARSKFELEAKISARVNSPYIVEVLDAGFDEASKSPFLVMELLDGQTLADRVHEHGPLEVDEALRLLEHVAAGLDAAHAYREASGAPKPIVHRDLKPENLFLARQHDGSIIAKILDYGIAKMLGDTNNVSQEVRGTPMFMAFEQITAGSLSPQTDVWAFGLIAYHMLTGARYWRSGGDQEESNLQALFAEILTLPLAAPSARLREQNVSIELPAAFDAWLLRCIDREASQRFPSAGAAVEALGRVFDRAARATVRPSFKPARMSEKTQTFAGADTPIKLPTPAPVASAGSVPAMATTRHRRSLSAALSSPQHQVVAGVVGGVALLGVVLWIVAGDGQPSETRPPATASVEAPSAAAARSPGAATGAAAPTAPEPSESARSAPGAGAAVPTPAPPPPEPSAPPRTERPQDDGAGPSQDDGVEPSRDDGAGPSDRAEASRGDRAGLPPSDGASATPPEPAGAGSRHPGPSSRVHVAPLAPRKDDPGREATSGPPRPADAARPGAPNVDPAPATGGSAANGSTAADTAAVSAPKPKPKRKPRTGSTEAYKTRR